LLLFIALIAVPVAAGVATVYLSRPWWWAAVAAVVVFLIAAIAPTPEPGEARVDAADLGFLAIAALIVVALTWLGARLGRRLRRSG
jgi:hypothetical protein